MANDRLYIQCDKCGELLFLGKHFLGSWTIYDTTLTEHSLAERLEAFLEKHWIECDFNRTDFSFITEMSDDFPQYPSYFSMKAHTMNLEELAKNYRSLLETLDNENISAFLTNDGIWHISKEG